MATAVSTPERDAEFFYSFVEFQVESVLFRLPKPLLERSTFFADMFEQPREPAAEAECKYCLEDVSAEEFRDFLRVLLHYPRRQPFQLLASSSSSYLSLMRLATDWKFDEVRDLVVRDLERIEHPALKLAVGREGPLELGDYKMLDMELAIQVIKYREKSRGSNSKSDLKDVRKEEMRKIFGEDFVKDYEEGDRLNAPMICKRTAVPTLSD